MELSENQIMWTIFITLIMFIGGVWVISIKQKKLPWYLLLLIFFTPLFWVIVGFIKSENPTKKTKIVSYSCIGFGVLMFIFSMMSLNFKNNDEQPIQSLGKSFTEILIENRINPDINKPNKYESLRTGNKYSNYYFNFSTTFPKDLIIDRGNSKYTIIRGSNEEYGISVSLNVVPGFTNLSESKIMENHKSFQNNPIQAMNKSSNGDYERILKSYLINNSGLSIFDFQMSEKKIRTTNYMYYQYNYREEVDNIIVEFIMITYQTILWGNTFTINYSTPKMFYNKKLVEDILFETNYIKPSK